MYLSKRCSKWRCFIKIYTNIIIKTCVIISFRLSKGKENWSFKKFIMSYEMDKCPSTLELITMCDSLTTIKVWKKGSHQLFCACWFSCWIFLYFGCMKNSISTLRHIWPKGRFSLKNWKFISCSILARFLCLGYGNASIFHGEVISSNIF